MTPDTHTCPRRAEGPHYNQVDHDTWTEFQGELACSYCGSLHPDRFMELVRAGWVVGPTDKNYKVYLGEPYTDAEIADRKAQWMSSSTAMAVQTMGERDGKTSEQILADVEQLWSDTVAPSMSSKDRGKFYFQHLSDEQQQQFIDLLNARDVRIGYPGRLYVTPFFAQRARVADPTST